LTGIIANVDNIFPEWSIAAQNWNDNQDNEEYVRYPTELKFQDLQSIRASLNLEPPESKVKSKGESRKSKDTSSEIQSEVLIDDEGRKLPRVIFRDDGSITRYDQQLLFKRTYSSEQIDRKTLQDQLQQNIFDCEQSSEDAVRRTELQLVYDAAVAERDVKLEKPTGPEIDHNMCAVFRIVSEFAMRNGGVDKVEGDKSTCKILWNSIYPQLPSGRPVYNAAGKYAVKLFLAGKWRKVIVTDMVPITADGPAIASSQEPLELWPVILSKAIYSVYTACG
jgi:Calpain family cysteine protease